MVPLIDANGRVVGWLWPDDPSDHRVPTPGQLRILRTFANHALAAITDAVHVDQLQRLAQMDGLTGALNRRAFFERLDADLQRARRSGDPLAVVLYDLDQFKALNDDHGHPAGDAALRAFTRILERSVRSADTVGRVGGDEFALILVGADAGDTARVVERIRSAMEDDPPAPSEVRATFGTARAPDDGWTIDELVEAADRRLYEHKRHRPTRHPHITLVEDA